MSKDKIGLTTRTPTVSPNFVIKYLRENEKCRETIFTFSNGVQVKSFKSKKGSKISLQYPFNWPV